MSYEVGVQMMEIYNEQVRDLLCSDGSNKRYPMHDYYFLVDVYVYVYVRNVPEVFFYWKDLTPSNIGNQE